MTTQQEYVTARDRFAAIQYRLNPNTPWVTATPTGRIDGSSPQLSLTPSGQQEFERRFALAALPVPANYVSGDPNAMRREFARINVDNPRLVLAPVPYVPAPGGTSSAMATLPVLTRAGETEFLRLYPSLVQSTTAQPNLPAETPPGTTPSTTETNGTVSTSPQPFWRPWMTFTALGVGALGVGYLVGRMAARPKG